MTGVSGAVFNTFGNLAVITTPIVIGYIVDATGSFTSALIFVGANALVAMISYRVGVGPISRLTLVEDGPPAATAAAERVRT